MFEWVHSLGGDTKSLLIAILGSVAGAIIGGIIKWLLDRKMIEVLKQEREAARKDRQAAIDGLESALKERERALNELAKREAENQERQRKLDELQRELNHNTQGVAGEKSKLNKLLTTLRGNDAGLWTTFPKVLPYPDYDTRIARRKPLIITIANNKGGVGKTTITGNLLAYFDNHLKLEVLAIDLDYQGSLSTMLRAEQDQADARKSNVNALLERGAGLGSLFAATRRLGQRLPRSELASPSTDLPKAPVRRMLRPAHF